MENLISRPDEGEQLKPQRHLIITAHGIRTFGQWQERLERLVQSCEPSIKVHNFHFGYYSILAYIFPPLRWLMTLRFRRALVKEAEREQWDRIDIVAHSFGTHLAAWGLYGIPSEKRPKIHTIIFASSVLKVNFPWSELIGTCVNRLVNDCGDRDNVLLFNQLAVLFTGRAGQVGFNGMTNDQFRNRFFDWGHSGYFMKEGKVHDDFMRDKWLPLLIREKPSEMFDERTSPSLIRGFLIFLANNATPIKLTLYLIILAIPTIVYFRLYLISEEHYQIARSQLLAFQASSHLDDRPDLALLLSVEANRRYLRILPYLSEYRTLSKYLTREITTSEAQDSLLTALLHYPYLAGFLHGHVNSVMQVAFSPDGKTLASASWDNTIRLWDVATRQLLGQPLSGFKNDVSIVAFSPDGKTLASSDAGTIRLWDMETGQALGKPLSGFKNDVSIVAFSPDWKTLASSDAGTIRLWDMETGQALGKPLSDGGGNAIVAFSPEGKTLASGSVDGIIRLWDLVNGQARGKPLKAYSGPIYCIAFDSAGKVLVSGGYDRTIQLWDVATGQSLGQPLRGHTGEVLSVAFSPDGKTLASGSWDKTIRLWDVTTGQSLGQPLTGHTGGVFSVAFSHDGKTLASSARSDTIIRLWDVKNHQLLATPLTGHSQPVFTMVFSRDGKTLASGSWDKTIRLWDVTTGQSLGQPLTGHTGTVSHVALSPDGKALASVSEGEDNRTIRMWDVATGQSLGQPLTGHTKITQMAFSPFSKSLVSVHADGTIRLWDLGTFQTIDLPTTGHIAVFSPDGRTLVSVNHNDCIIRLWDVTTGNSLGKLLTDSAESLCSAPFSEVSFSPDGKVLASVDNPPGTIQLWNMATRQALRLPFRPDKEKKMAVISVDGKVVELEGKIKGPSRTRVIFSPDGKTLVAVNAGTIQLYNVTSGQSLGERLRDNKNRAVQDVVFQPDGKILALVAGTAWTRSSADGAHLWDVATGHTLEQSLTKGMISAFSPDGRVLAVGDETGTIWLWDLKIQSWQALACRLANRNLTEEEWNQYLGNTERRRDTCQQFE